MSLQSSNPIVIDLKDLSSFEGTLHGVPVAGSPQKAETPETQSPRSSEPWSSGTDSPEVIRPQRQRMVGIDKSRGHAMTAKPRRQESQPTKQPKKEAVTEQQPTSTSPQTGASVYPLPPPGLEPTLDGPTLVQVFKDLRMENPSCVVKMRRVHRLGQKPDISLAQHFGTVVPVKDLHVVYSHMKTLIRGEMMIRCKPSGMAFLVLRCREDVDTVMAMGSEQVIEGVNVSLERFQHGHAETSALDLAEGTCFSL